MTIKNFDLAEIEMKIHAHMQKLVNSALDNAKENDYDMMTYPVDLIAIDLADKDVDIENALVTFFIADRHVITFLTPYIEAWRGNKRPKPSKVSTNELDPFLDDIISEPEDDNG